MADADFTQRRQLVELRIDRVLVTEGEVEIRYIICSVPTAARSCHDAFGRHRSTLSRQAIAYSIECVT